MQGTFFRVTQGLRTYQEQDALYAQGRTAPGHIVTNAKGGYSNHNFGCAVDCIPFLSGTGGELNWDAKSDQFHAMVAYLKAQGLVWGGSWVHMPDPPHMQLAGVPIPADGCRQGAFAKGGLDAVFAGFVFAGLGYRIHGMETVRVYFRSCRPDCRIDNAYRAFQGQMVSESHESMAA